MRTPHITVFQRLSINHPVNESSHERKRNTSKAPVTAWTSFQRLNFIKGPALCCAFYPKAQHKATSITPVISMKPQLSYCYSPENILTSCQRASSMFLKIPSETAASSRVKRKCEQHSSFLCCVPLFLLLLSPPHALPSLSLRNDTHANSGYPCHLPLTSYGSRDHVFSVPWDLHSAPIIWQLL